jgi:hypothetical protein
VQNGTAELKIWLAGRDVSRVSVADARNLGPVSADEWARLGYHTLGDLLRAGFEVAFTHLVSAFPARLNKNASRALLGALRGKDWRILSPEEVRLADSLVDRLRTERDIF